MDDLEKYIEKRKSKSNFFTQRLLGNISWKAFFLNSLFQSNDEAGGLEVWYLSNTERVMLTPTTTKHPMTLYHNQAMDVY